jgi:hypothetical protein
MIFSSDSFICGDECHRTWDYGGKHSSLNVMICQLANHDERFGLYLYQIFEPQGRFKRSTCVTRRITHHDGILTKNEPSPQQWVENTNVYFQKRYPIGISVLVWECMGFICDGSSSTDILYVNSGTEHWIFFRHQR